MREREARVHLVGRARLRARRQKQFEVAQELWLAGFYRQAYAIGLESQFTVVLLSIPWRSSSSNSGTVAKATPTRTIVQACSKRPIRGYNRRMGTLLVGARVLLAAVFVVAGAAKLLDRRGSYRSLTGFGVPARLQPALTILLPLAEIRTALALIPPSTARWGGLAALVLLLTFSAGIASAMRRGTAPPCHCFGQIHSAPAGRGTLVRNLALALPAGFVVIEGPGPSIATWVGDRTAAELVAVGLGILAVILGWMALTNWRERRSLQSELSDVKDRLAQAPPGLPVGSVAPDFALTSARTGEEVTLAGLRALGRPVALVFVSPSCGPCKTAFPEAGRWQQTLSNDLTVAIISDGHAVDNLGFVESSGADVLLQSEDYEAITAYRVWVTPTAVIVSPDGRIASALVPGRNMESLVRLTVRQSQAASTSSSGPVRGPVRAA